MHKNDLQILIEDLEFRLSDALIKITKTQEDLQSKVDENQVLAEKQSKLTEDKIRTANQNKLVFDDLRQELEIKRDQNDKLASKLAELDQKLKDKEEIIENLNQNFKPHKNSSATLFTSPKESLKRQNIDDLDDSIILCKSSSKQTRRQTGADKTVVAVDKENNRTQVPQTQHFVRPSSTKASQKTIKEVVNDDAGKSQNFASGQKPKKSNFIFESDDEVVLGTIPVNVI